MRLTDHAEYLLETRRKYGHHAIDAAAQMNEEER